MKLSKKEQFLINSGRSIETLMFCKKFNINQKDIVWFVNRIEKEFDEKLFNSKNFENNIKNVVRYFELNSHAHKINTKKRSLKNVMKDASQNLENESSINSRILHKFNDGCFMINLTHKELGFEGIKMNNCLSDYRKAVENKEICILALKDKDSKTICHLEIDNNGCISQAFEKSNTELNYETFGYIQEFFKIYEDKNIYKRIKKLGIGTLYDINLSHLVNGVPIVESFFPTKLSKSLLNEDKMAIDLNSCKKIRRYTNSSIKNSSKELEKAGLKDTIKKIKEYKDYINKSIDNMILGIEQSYDNYFILSDEIIKKIYGKKTKPLQIKIKEIITKKMNYRDLEVECIDYEEGIEDESCCDETPFDSDDREDWDMLESVESNYKDAISEMVDLKLNIL